MQSVLTRASQLWPKANEYEIELLGKIFAGMEESKAISILEDAKIDAKYQALPLKDIKARARSCGVRNALSGEYFDCGAVHSITGKHKICMVLAQDEYGANVQMRKYLGEFCKLIASDYIIFVENVAGMHDCRFKILGYKGKSIEPAGAF